MGVEDDLPDAYLFNIEMVPKWSEQWIPLLTIGFSEIPRSIETIEIMLRTAKDYKLVLGRLYKEGQDGVLCLCIEPSDYPHYISQAHQNHPRYTCQDNKWPKVFLDLAFIGLLCMKMHIPL